MSKYSRKQKQARCGSFKIRQTLFHPQVQSINDMKPYWDILTNMKGNPSPGKEMMRIHLECYWEGREYAEAYNQRQIAKDKKTGA